MDFSVHSQKKLKGKKRKEQYKKKCVKNSNISFYEQQKYATQQLRAQNNG